MIRSGVIAALVVVWSAGLPGTAVAARAWDTTTVAPVSSWPPSGGLAMTGTGETVAVYDKNNVTAAVYPAGGGDPTATVLADAGGQSPSVASGGGTTVAAWGDYNVWVATRPDGGTFGAVKWAAMGAQPIVRVNDRGDVALLFAGTEEYGNAGRLLLATRPAGAPAFSTPITIGSLTAPSYGDQRYDMALTDEGGIVVAWEAPVPAGAAIDVARSSVAGGPADPAQVVSQPGESVVHPSVAADAVGDAVVTWLSLGSVNPYYGAVEGAVGRAGSAFGAEMALGGSASHDDGARVAADPAGDALVSWGEMDPVSTNTGQSGPVEAVAIDLRTGRQSGRASLSSYNGGGGAVPAVDSQGDATVFYYDNALRIARGSAATARFGPSEPVQCAIGWSVPVAAGTSETGSAVLWAGYSDDKQLLSLANDRDAPQASPGSCPADQPFGAGATYGSSASGGGTSGGPAWTPPASHGYPWTVPGQSDGLPAAWHALSDAINTSGTQPPIGPIVASHGPTLPFDAPGAGTVRIWWVLRRKVIGQGHLKITRPGTVALRVVLTRAGERMLRSTAAELRIVAWGTFRAKGQTVTVKQWLWLMPTTDYCVHAGVGIRCVPGLGRRTPGGKKYGKVSHKGWPGVTGVLWILDHAGHRGTGTPYSDELLGGHGSDRLAGGPGADILWGDEWPDNNNIVQRDMLYGNAGDDWIYASHGTNIVSGGPGDDTIWAVYAVHLYVSGGPGNDTIIARRGRGTIDCGPGRDTVTVPRSGYHLIGCEVVRHH